MKFLDTLRKNIFVPSSVNRENQSDDIFCFAHYYYYYATVVA